jgi:hypothetical protein
MMIFHRVNQLESISPMVSRPAGWFHVSHGSGGKAVTLGRVVTPTLAPGPKVFGVREDGWLAIGVHIYIYTHYDILYVIHMCVYVIHMCVYM